MTELIEIKEKHGELFADSRMIADSLGIEHHSVIKLLDNENFERVRFEIDTLKTSGGEQKSKHALLTERQALILLTFVKNTKKAQIAKVKLVDAFMEMRSKLNLKKKSKDIRNNFTATLQNHGYDKQHQYIQTTIQMKGALGIEHKKDEMTENELKLITAAEMIAEVNLDNSKAEGYYQVNPICLNSTIAVQNAVRGKIA